MIRLLCKLGRHTRSRGRARREGAQWISRCRRCNAPMRRGDNGKWRIDRGEAQLADADADAFSVTTEGDPPTPEPKRRLARIGFPRIHLPLRFRRKAQD